MWLSLGGPLEKSVSKRGRPAGPGRLSLGCSAALVIFFCHAELREFAVLRHRVVRVHYELGARHELPEWLHPPPVNGLRTAHRSHVQHARLSHRSSRKLIVRRQKSQTPNPRNTQLLIPLTPRRTLPTGVTEAFPQKHQVQEGHMLCRMPTVPWLRRFSPANHLSPNCWPPVQPFQPPTLWLSAGHARNWL